MPGRHQEMDSRALVWWHGQDQQGNGHPIVKTQNTDRLVHVFQWQQLCSNIDWPEHYVPNKSVGIGDHIVSDEVVMGALIWYTTWSKCGWTWHINETYALCAISSHDPWKNEYNLMSSYIMCCSNATCCWSMMRHFKTYQFKSLIFCSLQHWEGA